ENKLDKALKKTFKQKTIELYAAADTHLVDCIREWRKGEAVKKHWYLQDMRDLVSLDVKLPKSKIGRENLDRFILAVSYAMEMESDQFREQIFYTREVIRRIIKLQGKEFFERSPQEIVEWFEQNPYQTITPEQAKGFTLFNFN
ncbi:MAG: hypothetical protein LUC43_08810, partial [Burkholderiales bacterium]|nr:hypothetical protein [Burkholderiales bacterium]